MESASSFKAPSSMRVRGLYLPARSTFSFKDDGSLSGVSVRPKFSMAGLSSPSRASRPRPKPLGFLVAIVCIPFQIRLAAWARLLTQGFLFHTAYELVAELDVCLGAARAFVVDDAGQRSEEHTSELQSLMTN